MDVSRSSFYYWKSRLNNLSVRTRNFISNILLFKEYHEKYPSHGYRWLNAKIRLDTGFVVSDVYAHKCCKTAGIKSKSKHYKYKKAGIPCKVYPNLLLSELNVTEPMQCVVSDMTAFYVKGIYYESTIYMDLWNNEILSHSLSSKRGELTVFDTIDRVAKGDIRLKIRDILGAFMFGGEASEKKVKVLSGGERSRLAMIKLLLEPVNFLILDEPTNHLDMRSKDVLKDAIRDFDGTVVVVSHDREFLDGLVSKVYEFGGGLVKEHLGGIYDFLQRKNIESLNDLQKPSLSTSSTMVSSVEEKTGPSNRLSYEQQKEQQKKVRRLEKAVEQCEARIGELEAAVKMLEDQLATPEGAADVSIYERHGALKKQLDEAVNAWEEASLELEEAQS